MFALRDATDAIEHLLGRAGALLRHGSAGVIFLRRAGAQAPLFATPEGPWIVGVGAFSTFPPSERESAAATMAEHDEGMQRFAGKRYLSGYLTRTTPADWAAHFGPAWDAFRAAKARYDSRNILNPEFFDLCG
jgi:FAD/FMN-containing dehydrogenase